jgi:hypothetical protein
MRSTATGAENKDAILGHCDTVQRLQLKFYSENDACHSLPFHPGNRASLIAFSIGTASGQNCFAICRNVSASSISHKMAIVPA